MFNGESGSGWSNNIKIATTRCSRFHAGDQLSFFKMSKHISPEPKFIFGCTIGVTNLIVGGSIGYDVGTFILNFHCPP